MCGSLLAFGSDSFKNILYAFRINVIFIRDYGESEEEIKERYVKD